MVECLAVNQNVTGSSPVGGASSYFLHFIRGSALLFMIYFSVVFAIKTL